jgi:uncharacterized Zn-binding protein involved in type VI secretion
MSAISHRNGDSRNCGATTVVRSQSFVTVDGQLWAVNGDPNTHGDGDLITSNPWLTISGLGVIVVGDSADPDDAGHADPAAVSGDGLIVVGS